MQNQKLYDVLNSKIGVHEYKSENNPRISEYHASVDGQSLNERVAWCASFINWGLAQVGLTGTKSRMARSFLNWGVECELDAGVIAVFSRGDNPIHGHVGIVQWFDDDYIYLLGGNQGDKVSVQKYRRSRLLGCRMPKRISRSKTVGAGVVVAGAGVTSAVSETLVVVKELKSTVDESKTQFDWLGGVSVALGFVVFVAGVFVIYDRIKKNKQFGV